MKIQKDHYDILLQATKKFCIDCPEFTPEFFIAQATSRPDYTFRWNLFYAAQRNLPDNFVSNVLYKYLNDSHIETAMKKIVKELF
jgi:hypothetical protein